MARFAVYAYGYSTKIPTCFVLAASLEEAWDKAKQRLEGIAPVVRVELCQPEPQEIH